MKNSELKNLLTERLNREKSDLSEFNALLNAVEKNKWLLNKRILKHLPENCSYEIKYNNYYVTFPSGNQHLLGWFNGSEQSLTPEKLRHADSCYSNGSEDRITKIENILNDKDLFELILKTHNNLEKAVKNLAKIMQSYNKNDIDSFHNPIYYELIRLITPNEEKRKALNEFRYN